MTYHDISISPELLTAPDDRDGIFVMQSAARHLRADDMGILSQSAVSGIDLMLFDTDIRARDRLRSPADLPAMLKDCHGGGGTNFHPLFVEGLMDDTVAALIVLTDGFGPAPRTAPRIPTLWVLTNDGEKPVPWGEMIRLPDLTPSPMRQFSRQSQTRPPR